MKDKDDLNSAEIVVLWILHVVVAPVMVFVAAVYVVRHIPSEMVRIGRIKVAEYGMLDYLFIAVVSSIPWGIGAIIWWVTS